MLKYFKNLYQITPPKYSNYFNSYIFTLKKYLNL